MNVLLLNGANKGDTTAETLGKLFKEEINTLNQEIVSVNLCDLEIGSCLGCFGCWIKTPGICVIDDAARELARSVMQSDLVVTVSPITFGGYSYELKKALDRLIPIISPFFKKIAGEIHHKPRYQRYPKYLSVGILSESNAEMAAIFQKLANRNAINMQGPAHASGIVLRNQTSQEIKVQVGKLLKEVGVSR